jgi:hypothetical protein
LGFRFQVSGSIFESLIMKKLKDLEINGAFRILNKFSGKNL